jgi:hypothetical protein
MAKHMLNIFVRDMSGEIILSTENKMRLEDYCDALWSLLHVSLPTLSLSLDFISGIISIDGLNRCVSIGSEIW